MGLFSKGAKGAALAAAAMGYVKKNPDKIKNGLAKAGDFADKKTHGKYSRQITGAQTKAVQAVDKASRRGGRGGIGPTSTSDR